MASVARQGSLSIQSLLNATRVIMESSSANLPLISDIPFPYTFDYDPHSELPNLLDRSNEYDSDDATMVAANLGSPSSQLVCLVTDAINISDVIALANTAVSTDTDNLFVLLTTSTPNLNFLLPW